jgi:hypothetical protein
MSADCLGFENELQRIHRVSDMLVSAHANLRDRYSRRATALDLSLLASSTWLVAVVFVEPRIGARVTPYGFDPQLWTGILSVLTFFLSIVQLKVDWKGCSDAHKRSFEMYSEVKRECGYILSNGTLVTKESCERVLARYDMATDVGSAVAESEFLRQKRRHLQKSEISRYLGQHPFASISLLRIRMWWRDNQKGHSEKQ